MSTSRDEVCSVCERRIMRVKMARHVAKECKGKTHCTYCARPSVSAMFARLRAGELPALVATSLQLTLEYVYETRGKGRAEGCLPRPTPEEVKAERAHTAALRHTKRQCSECPEEFIPQLGKPGQSTCGKRKCLLARHAKMARERDETGEEEPVMDEKTAAQMAPRARADAEIAAMAEAQGLRILATKERQHALWLECLGVAA